MQYYRQTKNVSWLSTPADTVWVSTDGDYIQPENPDLITTPLGVDLSLLDDEHLLLFTPIDTIEV